MGVLPDKERVTSAFTRQGSLVQSQPRPPFIPLDFENLRYSEISEPVANPHLAQ